MSALNSAPLRRDTVLEYGSPLPLSPSRMPKRQPRRLSGGAVQNLTEEQTAHEKKEESEDYPQ